MEGKNYGLGNFAANSFVKQELLNADLRSIYYKPKSHKELRGGLAWMAGVLAANALVVEKNEASPEIRAVAGFNLAPTAVTPDIFLRAKFRDDTEAGIFPQYILYGRFHAPFGLLTDEHRTYTKIQTQNSWHQNLETGALFSANPIESIHYDLALVNGEKSSATFTQDGATRWGKIVNVRWLPASLPFMLGGSFSRHSRGESEPQPQAQAFYALLSMDRLTKQRIPVYALFEFVRAKRMNTLISNFATDAYQTATQKADSQGMWAMLGINVHRHVELQYKFDRLILDRSFAADAFDRHGVGIKARIGPNLISMFRWERAKPHRSLEYLAPKTGGQSAIWALLQLGL